MSGVRNLAAADYQAPKKTVKLYSSVPSLLQPHTFLNKVCKFNCGIRVQRPGCNRATLPLALRLPLRALAMAVGYEG